jgi:hypothetical protein
MPTLLVPASWGSPLREFNDCHSKEDGRFCEGTTDSNEPDDFFHPDYGTEGWTYPATTHKVVRDGGLWGYSHGNSSFMAGLAAKSMGIPGWEVEDWREAEKRVTNAVDRFITHIAASPGSEEPLYHGFQNTRGIDFKVGDTMRLPLVATSGSSGSISYGMRMEKQDQEGEPTLFAFEKGTQMVAYGKWGRPGSDPDGDSGDFKEVYSEAIVAGGYKVTKVTRAQFPYNAHWDVRNPKWDGKVPVKVVYLQQTETYDPVKGWVKRG